jgi:isopentenyl diphosphate isomerase/L-lactate dehydrogenase-like FMN-dependent dehydrogenase
MTPTITSVADGLHYARRRLPKTVMNSFENGAGELATVRANERAFDELMFLPRGGDYPRDRSAATTILGHSVDVPLIASSIGALGLAHPDGEAGVARAIGAAGGIQFVSTFTSTPIEDITRAASGPVYYQVYYLGGGREQTSAMIERARRAGCAGLVLVVDSPVGHTPVRALPIRERRRLPAEVSVAEGLRFAPQMITRPGWTLEFIRGRVPITIPMAMRPDGSPMPMAEARGLDFGEAFRWDDLDWIRDVWDCQIVIKGVLSIEDARRAADVGADAIVVSNHGGNRLDGTVPSLEMLPRIVESVGTETEVLFDSGIRRGTDVVKAIALGARGVGLGRAYLYPLIAAGERGVSQILAIFRRDIENTLALLGCARLADIGAEHIVARGAVRVP